MITKKLHFKTMIITLIFFILMTAGGILQAQQPPVPPPPGEYSEHEMPMPDGQGICKFHRGMIPDLSDEQVHKIKALKMKMMHDFLPLRNDLGEKKAKLRTLTTVESPDIKAINKLIDEMSTVEASVKKLKIAHKQDVRKLLTPDQKVIYDMDPDLFQDHILPDNPDKPEKE